MTNGTQAQTTNDPLPFTFGGFTVPVGCRRIFITAELEPASGDPRIQPTGFPDIGPVMYPDPSGQSGLICLIESEASMANRLEEVCFSNKYEGTFKNSFQGLPYLRAESGTAENRVFKTSSTLDGHRFASDFLAKGKANFGAGEKTLAEHIKTTLGMNPDGKTMPVARIPDIFQLVMELDTMSLIHGFQISNEQIAFVGLRLARALTASIVGLNCERVAVPGIKFNVGQVESESGQAIFQKQRVTAKTIKASFSIDVGLLASLRLDTPANRNPGRHQNTRFQLLLAIALWKVAAFLDLLRVELSLRTECKLRLKEVSTASLDPAQKDKKKELAVYYTLDREDGQTRNVFPFTTITQAPLAIAAANLPQSRHPLVLAFGA